MQLKYKEELFRVVDYEDINKFISDAYQIAKYECVAEEEWHNDSCHAFCVEPAPLNTYEYDIQNFNKKDYHFMLGTLLDDCCHKGLLRPGNYIVSVSW